MTQTAIDIERELQQKCLEFRHDPYKWVMWAYPWGEPGPLEHETGPDDWQRRVLMDISRALKTGKVFNQGKWKEVGEHIFIACRAGRGPGKSTLMAWLDQWFMATRGRANVVTTANTENQLKTKTWREQLKWHNLCLVSHWFEWSATTYRYIAEGQLLGREWESNAIPWSASRPTAIQGTHGKHVMIKIDEASGIDDVIFENILGSFTDVSDGCTKILILFGNPNYPKGFFHDCFEDRSNNWLLYEVDVRETKRVSKVWIDFMLNDICKGDEDDDRFRVHVKGIPPRVGIVQFLGTDLVKAAAQREYARAAFVHAPMVLTADFARSGDDETVFLRRKGVKAYGLEVYTKRNAEWLAGRLHSIILDERPEIVFLDMGNIGAAIYDILAERYKHNNIVGVWFGGKATDELTYSNKRAEMYGRTREWLEYGSIPNDKGLIDDLTAVEYGHNPKGQIVLSPKTHNVSATSVQASLSRLVDSPDRGDALVLSFAEPLFVTSMDDDTPRHAITDTAPHSKADEIQSSTMRIKNREDRRRDHLQRMTHAINRQDIFRSPARRKP